MDPTWILVADNSRARIFTIERPRGPLIEYSAHDNPDARKPERELVTDRPGRESDPGGHSRSAFDGPSAKAESGERFARQLAELLEKARSRGKFKRLYVVAAPHFLGSLRESLDSATRRCVEEAIAKDVAHESPERIRRHLPERLSASLA